MIPFNNISVWKTEEGSFGNRITLYFLEGKGRQLLLIVNQLNILV